MASEKIQAVLYDREQGELVPLKTGMFPGPFSNGFILEHSPLEQIAKMLDFEFPSFVTDLFNVLENPDREEAREKYGLDIANGVDHRRLIEYFWAIAKKGNVMDLMFFFDYRLYLNFFLQYPIVTGKELDKNWNFTKILEEYRQMEMPGNIAQITREDEYYFVWSGDLPEELATLDEVIASYEAEGN